MMKPSVVLFILGFWAVDTSAQLESQSFERGRFNVTLNELKEQCNYNAGNYMFDNILRSLEYFRNYRNTLLGQLNTLTAGSSAQGDQGTAYVINQICETNPEMINAIGQLIDNVQLCLSQDRRLSQAGLQKITGNMLTGVCLQLEFERALFTQPQCLDELMSSLRSPGDECSQLFPKYRTVYTLEPIPILYSDDECSDFIKAADCRFSSRRSCDPNLISIIKHHFDMSLGLLYCDSVPTTRFQQNNLLRFIQ